MPGKLGGTTEEELFRPLGRESFVVFGTFLLFGAWRSFLTGGNEDGGAGKEYAEGV